MSSTRPLRSLFHFDLSPLLFNNNYLSAKILLFTATSYSIVVHGYYDGMLTSFLTSKAPAPLLTSFADAITFGYQVITLGGTKHATDLRTAPVGSGRHLVYHETMKGNPGVYYDSFEDMAAAALQNPLGIAIAGSEFSFAGDSRY